MMANQSVRTLGVIAMLGMIVAGCASDGTTMSSSTGSTKSIDRIATGSVEDSLEACLARIPQDASAGQQMVAEQSCRRDQAARHQIFLPNGTKSSKRYVFAHEPVWLNEAVEHSTASFPVAFAFETDSTR